MKTEKAVDFFFKLKRQFFLLHVIMLWFSLSNTRVKRRDVLGTKNKKDKKKDTHLCYLILRVISIGVCDNCIPLH